MCLMYLPMTISCTILYLFVWGAVTQYNVVRCLEFTDSPAIQPIPAVPALPLVIRPLEPVLVVVKNALCRIHHLRQHRKLRRNLVCVVIPPTTVIA